MKRILFVGFMFINILTFSQSRDLYSLAKGEYLGFNAVFDKEGALYGYVALYGYGKSGDNTKKFEYVFLDKNLNPVANKEFEGDITAKNYYGVLDFRNNLLLIPYSDDYAFGLRFKKYFKPRTMEVNLKTNEIKYKTYYDYQKDGSFKEIAEPKTYWSAHKEEKAEKKQNGFVYNSFVYEIKEGGFLVSEYDDYDKYIKNQSLKRYDIDKKLLWEYKYNEDGTKNNREYIKIIDRDDKHIYAIFTKAEKKNKTFILQIFDIKTGKIIHTKPLEGLNQDTWNHITSLYDFWKRIDNDKVFNDKIVMVGRFYESYAKSLYTGFVRLIIDKKTFGVDVKELHYKDFKKFIPNIDDKGFVEKGYNIKNRDLFFLEDGSIGFLFEKFKPGGNYSHNRTTDMVYAFTDKDFKLKDVKVLEKEKTKYYINSDYLFYQYLNKGKDVVFFYRDYQKDKDTKEKSWNLFINTLINGEFNQEKIKISEKDKYFITPYVGKEGYILLREYNEKDKYNQIRLERLNY